MDWVHIVGVAAIEDRVFYEFVPHVRELFLKEVVLGTVFAGPLRILLLRLGLGLSDDDLGVVVVVDIEPDLQFLLGLVVGDVHNDVVFLLLAEDPRLQEALLEEIDVLVRVHVAEVHWALTLDRARAQQIGIMRNFGAFYGLESHEGRVEIVHESVNGFAGGFYEEAEVSCLGLGVGLEVLAISVATEGEGFEF